MTGDVALEADGRRCGAAARAEPLGPGGRGTDFSELQLAQLRTAVRDAIREEFWAAQLQSGGWKRPQAAEARQRSGPRRRAGSKAKAPDEPVVAGFDDACSDAGSHVHFDDVVGRMDVPVVAGFDDACSERVDPTESRRSALSTQKTMQEFIEAAEGHVDLNDFYQDNSVHVQKLRRLAHSIVQNTLFDFAIGLLIISNQVCIGIEVQFQLDNRNVSWMFWLEGFFIVCFTSEALLRLAAHGRSMFSSSWFWFDIFLVGTSIVCVWIIEPIRQVVNVDKIPLASQVLILRAFRIIRMIRAFRLMTSTKELWLLCSGLMRSARTMASVAALLCAFLFIFSCLGVDLITKSEKLTANAQTRVIVDTYFQSLPYFMLTLMQFANADSIASIYYPLCQEEPFLIAYFASLWMVVTVVLMNLVTAIIVENALAKSANDEKERLAEIRIRIKTIVPEIKAVFDMIDKDGSGTLTVAEVAECARSGELILPSSISKYVQPERLADILQSFDVDGSGEIDKDEFVDGVVYLVVTDAPVETTQILILLRQCHAMLEAVHNKSERVRQSKPLGRQSR